MLTDIELLFECVNKLEQRRRAVLGDEHVVIDSSEGTMQEALMHGDYIDASELDKFSRLAGTLHYQTMRYALDHDVDGYTIPGNLIGMVEEFIVIGIMWERQRRALVARGEMEPKAADLFD